jgi:hypothetical protein
MSTTDNLIKFYRESPFSFGTGDIFCFGSADTNERLGDLICVLGGMRNAKGHFPISRITVLLPPLTQGLPGNDEPSLRNAISQAAIRFRGHELTETETAFLRELVHVVRSPNLEVSHALTLVQAAESNSVVIFLYAARYRDESVVPPRLKRGSTAALSEDVWVPYLHAFAKGAMTAAKQTECYVLLDAGETWPYRTENIDLLNSIENCSVAGRQPKNDPWKTIAEKLEEWVAEIKAGHLGSVFSSIESLPEAMNPQKGILKIQLLKQAAPQAHLQLLDLIRAELKTRDEIDAEMRVKLARLSEDAGDSDLASELLAPAISLLTSQEWLESALLIARDIGNSMFEDECLKRLEASFPGSYQLHRRRLSKLIYGQRYDEALAMLENEVPGYSSEDAAFYKKLVLGLRLPDEPGYQALTTGLASKWPALAAQAYFVCIEDARARGLRQEALRLAASIELTGDVARRAAAVLVRAVRELLLLRAETGQLIVNPNELREPVHKLVRYLTQNPDDGVTRGALVQLLSIPITGSFGLPIITVVTLDLADKATIVRKNKPAKDSPPSFSADDFVAFLKPAFDWMEREGPLLPGRSVLPAELLTASAEVLTREITNLIQYIGNRLVSKEDMKYFENVLFLGLVVAPHSSDPGADLILLRLAAGQLILAGRVQRARDLAEQILHIAGEDPFRARLAWYSFADIYHRLNNLTEALVGMSCALACQSEITPQQAFYETNLLVRLLRDLHLPEMAKPLLPRSRALLKEVGLEKEYAHRLVTMELGIRAMELSRHPNGKSSEVRALVREAEKNCRVVFEQDDELAPAAALLGQSVYLSHFLNIPIKENVSETLETVLEKLGEPASSLIRTLTAQMPSARDVFGLAKRVETARFSEDAGFDVRYVVMAAERLLDSEEAVKNPRIAAFAIELLADQAIEKPAKADHSTDFQEFPSSIETPSWYAEELSRLGIDVNLLAISSSGRLVRVAAADGVLGNVIREDTAVFSEERLEEWSKDFPHKYGTISNTDNLFYTSMNGLGLTLARPRRMLVVTDTVLQQLPPNLLSVSDDFIGRTVAMAAAPSLLWLKAARSSTRVSNGRKIAWISTAAKGSENPTLSMVAERLTSTLETHGVELHTDAEIPVKVKGSDLAIIAAHGGITPWGSFFQVVADEADLRLTSAAASEAMRNIGVVILFVCSGGRFDRHPMASTTVGFTKDLLESGCSTVIASPWPLDARVPSHWLPRFLEVWDAGGSAIDANFEANKTVEKAMGNSPAYCLAMTVFGDPLIVKPQ